MLTALIAGASVASSAAVSYVSGMRQEEANKQMAVKVDETAAEAKENTTEVITTVAPAVKTLSETMGKVTEQVANLEAKQTASLTDVSLPLVEQLDKAQQAVDKALADLKSEHGPINEALEKAKADIQSIRQEIQTTAAPLSDAIQKLNTDVKTMSENLEKRIPNLQKHTQIGKHVHFNHPNGNTYIRPAKKGKEVVIADMGGDRMRAGNAFWKWGDAAYVRGGGKENPLHIGDKDTSTVQIARNGTHAQIGAHTHFNHPSGNTYVRPATDGGKVIIGDMQSNRMYAGNNAFIKDGNNAYLRGGRGKGDVVVGDHDTDEIKVSPNRDAHVQIGKHTHFGWPKDGNTYIRATSSGKSSVLIGDYKTKGVQISPNQDNHVQIGRHTHFGWPRNGATYIRPGGAGKDIVLGAEKPEWNRPRRIAVQADEGICFGDTCLNEETLKQLYNEQGSQARTSDAAPPPEAQVDENFVPEGTALKCSKGELAHPHKVFRYTNGTLRHYPNAGVADSWDKNWRKFVTKDCTGIPGGPTMKLPNEEAFANKAIEFGPGNRVVDCKGGKCGRGTDLQI